MKNFLGIASSLLVLTFSSAPAISADEEGKFAAKGAARRDCNDFLTAQKNGSSDVYVFGGWLEGYLSGFNQFQSDTYDIMPWQTTELLMLFLQQHCKSHPDMKFFDAVNSLIASLFPIRLEKEDQVVAIDVQNAKTYFYREILMRAKKRLQFLGYYPDTELTVEFTESDIQIFSEYQNKKGLTVTGIPDQYTLTSLFLKPNTQTQN